MSTPRLSVIIITKNEEGNLRDCLNSVTWSDEIVVLDSGSIDRTESICMEFGARFEQSPDWPGFGPQKNRALDFASGDWVLSIDADERVTPKLRAEIERILATHKTNNPGIYALPRRSWFCGREMRHSGWWPDYVTRLFRRGSARFSDDKVHERLVFAGQAEKLSAPLHHISYRTLSQVLDKTNSYSTAGAEMMRMRGKSGGLGAAIGHGLWAFVRTYILRRGFLDGKEGFILAVSNAEGTYYRYLKRMYLDKVV
jgi:glycosyltransferase involved in cell wall biosynthesis